MTEELGEQLGLSAPLRDPCPYGTPPEIIVESETQWTINNRPREKADPHLCQMIMTKANACVGCPMNSNEWEKTAPSEFLVHILELSELIDCGFHADLPMVEWKALALLKRKRNQAEIRRMKESQKNK